MELKKHSLKCVVCVVLTFAIIFSMVLCTTLQYSAADSDLSQTGADTYYFYGINNNGPNFPSMSSPTGTFTYDSSKGYYYYDIESFSGGDYCFFISTSSASGSTALGKQATTKVASGGSYYLVYGSYSGHSCFHIWNDKKEAVRIYFTSEAAGVNAVALSSVSGSETTAPTSAETSSGTTTDPTTAPTQGGGATGSKMVYCRNTADWSNVYCYMWKDKAGENAAWPGVKMTDIGDDVWQYEITGNFDMIIFNNNAGTQTGDMSFPGDGHIYDNSTKKWDVYDTSPLKVKSFSANLLAPQYKGTDITLTTEATGIGTVNYKFSVTDPDSNTTVIADFSENNKAVWTPQTTGIYTIVYEYKDTVNNTNKRTLEYEIKDDQGVEDPILKGVTPKPCELELNKNQTFSVKASGGNIGTNLLFYKFKITDPSGNIVNVPYYTKTNTCQFTPTSLGAYTLTVYVQGSDNETIERSYTYTSVTDAETPSEPQDPTTPEPTTPQPTTPPTQPPTSVDDYLRGDSDNSGNITVLDATCIQRLCARLITEADINMKNADANLDTQITIMDATAIQRYLAKLETW